jgi:ADP-ribose pyrophosphatase
MPLKKWKKLSRTEILKHPRMHLVEDEVELPDGKTAKYLLHGPAMLDSVIVIAINEAGEMLLQREYNYPPNEILWQLPGGAIEKDEDILAAAKRELSEESGVTANDCKIVGYYYMDNRRSDRKQYVVVGRDLEKRDAQGDAEEFIESYWLPIGEVKRKIRDGEFHNITLHAALNVWLHGE